MTGWKEKREQLGGGQPLLKGEDIPKNVQSVVITVAKVREAPSTFKSPFIIDLAKPVYEKEAWAVNRTNGDKLAEVFGNDWCDGEATLKGKRIKLNVMLVNNPKTNRPVRSLFVEGRG